MSPRPPHPTRLPPCSRQIHRWMEDAGLETWVDGVGNVHGRLVGVWRQPRQQHGEEEGEHEVEHDAGRPPPAVLVGSHYDTVLDGGA